MCVLSKERALALFILACVLISLLSSGGLYGQAISTGTVQGVVTDPTGASVAGATVTLTETATSTSRSTVTNESGRYIFADVPPGIYDVSVSKTGFRVMKFIKQEVTVGETFALDAKLELGSNVETVEVSANSASMDTASATTLWWVGWRQSAPQ
jgi:hypothetical protein